MATVQITGWNPGFNKVACTQLIQGAAGLDLADAKRVTDRVLEGQIEAIALGSRSTAEQLVVDLAGIGAMAHIVG